MVNILAGELGGVPYKYFGDWTDRIAKGELPHAKPPRPSRRRAQHRRHDLGLVATRSTISTTSSRRIARNPTVNAYGPIYGSPEYATDDIPILDPKTNTVTAFKAPVRDPNMPESLGPGHAAMLTPLAAVGLLGQRADLGHPGQQSQLDVRPEGPAVARGGDPRRR